MHFPTLLPVAATLILPLVHGFAAIGAFDSFDTIEAAGPGVPAANADSLKDKTWNPPANLISDLDAVWKHDMATRKPDMTKFKNYGYQQILANDGHINFCVRWDSKKTASPELRRQIDSALKKQTKKWTDILVGYEGWPYTDVPVKVVGWSARSQGLLPGYNESEGFRFYNTKDQGGIPECSPACGRFFHQDNNYSKCPGGKDMHYDMSLWLTDGMGGGAGGDWGQRLGTEQFLEAMKSRDDIHIFLHEMGHTFGLNDFYDWKPPGQKNFIMMAGSAMFITEFDAWMLRDWWRHLKPNVKLP